jgi:CubicO group peptidase (beta-lactamase class C family)
MTQMRSALKPNELIERMTRLLSRLEHRKGVRHAIVGVACLDGSWEWSGAVGTIGPSGEQMRSEVPWFLASVTKLHIAAVLLRLSEQGLIDLEAPIGNSVPSPLVSGLHVYRGIDHTDEITPTHLLGHMTGLPDYLDERPQGGRSLVEEILEEDRAWCPEDAVRRAQELLTPHFVPSDPQASRARIRYSDTNYQLLIVIAEHVTGKTMAQLYREMLFEPLELRHTWLPGSQPIESVDGPATVWLGDQTLAERPLAMQSFGDLYGTVDDVLRFGRALFTGELFDKPATAELMWQRFNRFGFPRGLASLRAPSWPIEYGLGVMRFELSRLLAGGLTIPTLIGHTGSTGSWLWYAPQLGLITAGTVDQTAAAAVPFRPVTRALAGLDD